MHRYQCVLFMDWCFILIVKTVRNQFTSALKQIATLYSICMLGPDAWKLNKQSCRLKVSKTSSGSTLYIWRGWNVDIILFWHLSQLSWVVEAYIDCAVVYRLSSWPFYSFFFLKLLIIILLFDSPVSVKDQATMRIIYFNVIYFFLSLFGKKVRMAALMQKKKTVLKAQVQCM